GMAEVQAEIVSTLARTQEDSRRLEILNGLILALQGERQAPKPPGWDAVESRLNQSASAAVRARTQTLSLKFGSSNALASLRQSLMVSSSDPGARQTALDSLLGARDPELAPLLQQLLADEALRGQALRGLAAYDDPKTPAAILKVYPNL